MIDGAFTEIETEIKEQFELAKSQVLFNFQNLRRIESMGRYDVSL